MRDYKKPPLISVPPVTSTEVRIGPQNFLAFSFNPIVKQVYNFITTSIARPKLLNLNQEHKSKIIIFSGPTVIKLKRL